MATAAAVVGAVAAVAGTGYSIYASEQREDMMEEAAQKKQEKRQKIREQETKQRKSIIRGAISDQNSDSLFDILGSSQV